MTGPREAMAWDSSHAAQLDSERRQRELPADAVVELARLGGGETVVDFGAGTGRITFALAGALDQGEAIGVERDPEMYDLLAARLHGRARARALRSSAGVVALVDATVDRIVCIDVLHHLAPADIRELSRLLAPRGRLLLVDWTPHGERDHGPPPETCLTADEACEELLAAGLATEQLDSPFPNRYTLIATRRQEAE